MRRLGVSQLQDEPVSVPSQRVNFFELKSVDVVEGLGDWVNPISGRVELPQSCIVHS